MPSRFSYAVQLRLTRQEWLTLARLAGMRGLTIEGLVRETLRLSAERVDRLGGIAQRSHLRVVEQGR
jgi:hypothetical protein